MIMIMLLSCASPLWDNGHEENKESDREFLVAEYHGMIINVVTVIL